MVNLLHIMVLFIETLQCVHVFNMRYMYTFSLQAEGKTDWSYNRKVKTWASVLNLS